MRGNTSDSSRVGDDGTKINFLRIGYTGHIIKNIFFETFPFNSSTLKKENWIEIPNIDSSTKTEIQVPVDIVLLSHNCEKQGGFYRLYDENAFLKTPKLMDIEHVGKQPSASSCKT